MIPGWDKGERGEEIEELLFCCLLFLFSVLGKGYVAWQGVACQGCVVKGKGERE